MSGYKIEVIQEELDALADDIRKLEQKLMIKLQQEKLHTAQPVINRAEKLEQAILKIKAQNNKHTLSNNPVSHGKIAL